MKKIIFFFCIISIIQSCSSDSEVKNSSPNADFNYKIKIDEIKLSDNSNDADGDPLICEWSCQSNLISLSNKNGISSSFELTNSNQEQEIDITLTVNDTESENSVTKTILIPKLTESIKLGLGSQVNEEKSNDVNYDWYLDQSLTGKRSSVNCGPTSVTMAIKWANEDFYGKPEDARNTFKPKGGWWYTDDIISYLNLYHVSNYTIRLDNIDNLKEQLDKNNILIICLDMFYISNQKKDSWHVDKFYTTANKDWGHFIIAKGYKVVDGKVFYEIYDPNGYERKYSDGSNKGVNRYYRAEDLDKATNIWWDYAIVVSQQKSKTKKGINPSTIKHQKGR